MKAPMRASVLLVDDDDSFATEFSDYLGLHGLSVTRMASLEGIAERLQALRPDLVILDQFLVGLDTLTMVGEVREQFGGGIVVLTGNEEKHDRIVGLELGADDFISKAQPPREILARLRAVLRRVDPVRNAVAGGPAGSATPAPADKSPWKLDTLRRQVCTPDGVPVPLTSTEFNLLAYLKAREGEPVSRDDLSMAILRRGFVPYDRSLDNLVGRIRQAFKPFPGTGFAIKSVRGVGYVLVGFEAQQV